MIEINYSCSCVTCDKKLQFDSSEFDTANIICNECRDKFDSFDIQQAILDASEKDYLWIDREGYVGFKSEEEKTYFMRGVKKGYMDALFWIADYFDEVNYFEAVIEKMKDVK